MTKSRTHPIRCSCVLIFSVFNVITSFFLCFPSFYYMWMHWCSFSDESFFLYVFLLSFRTKGKIPFTKILIKKTKFPFRRSWINKMLNTLSCEQRNTLKMVFIPFNFGHQCNNIPFEIKKTRQNQLINHCNTPNTHTHTSRLSKYTKVIATGFYLADNVTSILYHWGADFMYVWGGESEITFLPSYGIIKIAIDDWTITFVCFANVKRIYIKLTDFILIEGCRKEKQKKDNCIDIVM